jgi:hypothetical protein
MTAKINRCAYCGDRVDPADKGIVYAIKREQITIMGGTEWVNVGGSGAWFHRKCLAMAADYREAPKP